MSARSVVMACYNMIIPHIVSDLPEEQAAALKLQGKSPLQYTTVGLTNWRAMKELGIGLAMSPGNMHQAVLMDFPVSKGGYEYSKTPKDPCVIQMISCPYGKVGAPRLEQFREARYRMLALQYKDYEQEVRSHLSGMLPKELFDFDKDVASISVNRWAHGYTTGGPGNSTRIGRQPFGRITIANSDSAPGADAKTAMMMAYRAVNELGSSRISSRGVAKLNRAQLPDDIQLGPCLCPEKQSTIEQLDPGRVNPKDRWTTTPLTGIAATWLSSILKRPSD